MMITTTKKCLERFWIKKSRRLSCILCSNWYVITSKCIWKLLEKKCVETYELDSAQFLSASGLALQACLKKTKIKLKLLTDTDILQIVEKGVRCGIWYAIHWYIEANNKYMKNYKKRQRIIISHVLRCKEFMRMENVSKITCRQFLIGKNISKFDKSATKSFNENNDKIL